MASLQALCSICEKKVTAFTLLGDNDLGPLLDRNEEIIVRHVFHDGTGRVSTIGGASSVKRKRI